MITGPCTPNKRFDNETGEDYSLSELAYSHYEELQQRTVYREQMEAVIVARKGG